MSKQEAKTHLGTSLSSPPAHRHAVPAHTRGSSSDPHELGMAGIWPPGGSDWHWVPSILFLPQDMDSEKRKVICKTLRFLAHYHGASLMVSPGATRGSRSRLAGFGVQHLPPTLSLQPCSNTLPRAVSPAAALPLPSPAHCPRV